MDTCVSAAICAFISNASSSFYLHFPFLSDHAWNSSLSCSECELDAKRSIGFMALYSSLEVALVSAAKQHHPVPDLGPLREAILSDHFLALLLITAGVSDSCSAREYEQASRAFVVFVEMVILDKGLPEFVVWFADVFDPIISVAFKAFSRPVCETPSKHPLASYDYSHSSASKRRRTGSDVSRTRSSTSTLDTLRRLRQRQVLSVSCSSTASLLVMLDTQTTTGTDTQSYQTTAKQEFLKAPTMTPLSSANLKPCTFSSLSSASLGARNEMRSTQTTQTSSTKTLLSKAPCSQSETTVSATSARGATSSSEPLLSAAPAPIIQQRSIVSNTEEPNVQLSSILGTSKICPTDTSTAQPIPATANNLHEAAILFIEETINMHIKNTIDNVAYGRQTIESTIEKATSHEQTIENTIDKVISQEQATVNAVERVTRSSPLEVQKRQGSALIGGNKVTFGNKKWQSKENHARPPQKQSSAMTSF
ncbi:hypothetical protein GGX14DRAFT_386011 [Mycena pura]|uniref:Uncharacterized protein n=1 Tax=Mycena pura TaxID=153505 RepID=A0AAD7E3Z6_9AGAR|nr:hypothetical protein GGX14DRAFT_386011 [Mycena pura]